MGEGGVWGGGVGAVGGDDWGGVGVGVSCDGVGGGVLGAGAVEFFGDVGV